MKTMYKNKDKYKNLVKKNKSFRKKRGGCGCSGSSSNSKPGLFLGGNGFFNPATFDASVANNSTVPFNPYNIYQAIDPLTPLNITDSRLGQNMNSDNYTGVFKGGNQTHRKFGGKKYLEGYKKTKNGTQKKRVGGRRGPGKKNKRKGPQKGGMFMQPTGTAVPVSNYANAMGGVFPMTPFGGVMSNSAPVPVNPYHLNMGGMPNKLI
jgi:hypothetical protein